MHALLTRTAHNANEKLNGQPGEVANAVCEPYSFAQPGKFVRFNRTISPFLSIAVVPTRVHPPLHGAAQ